VCWLLSARWWVTLCWSAAQYTVHSWRGLATESTLSAGISCRKHHSCHGRILIKQLVIALPHFLIQEEAFHSFHTTTLTTLLQKLP
jgi:hypothetical protein